MPSLKHPSRQLLTTAMAMSLAAVFGCGGPANGRLAVSGAVTLDGAPLDNGIITFYPKERGAPSAGASVSSGGYSLPDGRGLMPGEYSVAIDAPDESGASGTVRGIGMAIPVSRIPPQYNAATTLTATVEPGGANKFDFELSTGKEG